MNLTRMKRPVFRSVYYPLSELAALLSTSAEALLDAACEDKLRVFIRVPDGATICSVHEDAVALDDLWSRQGRAERRVRAPDPDESLPINSSLLGVEGLVLSYQDCQKIQAKRVHRQYLFKSGLRTFSAWLESITPITGHIAFCGRRTLDHERWFFAFYSRDTPIQFLEGRGYSQPLGIDISPADLFASLPEIERYLDSIDANVYLADLFEDGHVVVRPEYFSEKLNCLINAGEKYWRTINPSACEKFDAQRQKVEEFLSVEFQGLCRKDEPSGGLMDFALRAITPVFARKDATSGERAASPSYITPELMALMAAAKWSWGVSTVRLDQVSSHPVAENIVQFLGRMGLKGNDRRYGVTLIRPEMADLGRPVEKTVPHHEILKQLKAGIKKA